MITNSDFQAIKTAIGAYTDEAYTNARKLSGTGVVDQSAGILVTDSESYIGQMRWYKPLNPVINIISLSDPTAGTTTGINTDTSKYIKSMRSHGASQVNLQRIITQEDGLAKIARDFGETQAQDESNAILSILKGVAQAEVDRVAGTGTGLLNFDTDADVSGANANGFFVDVNANGAFGAAATGSGDARQLFDASASGAAKFSRLFKAVGMAWKDYEPEWMYMLTTPEMMAELRVANIVDQDAVTDGNLRFETIFNGKFRLLPTRSNQGNWAADAVVNNQSTKTTYLIGPNSIAWSPISLTSDESVEVGRNPSAYLGGGTSEIWYRWGYIGHPSGYTWAGAENAFASDANYAAAGAFARKISALNLSILPIFHA